MEVLTSDTFKRKVFDFENNEEWKFAGVRPAIVDFYADWCGPCQALAPVLEEVAEAYQGQIDIYKVNTDNNPDLAALFGVRGIPAILFIPKAGEPSMNSGFIPRQGFDQAIRELFGLQPGQ